MATIRGHSIEDADTADFVSHSHRKQKCGRSIESNSITFTALSLTTFGTDFHL